MEYDKAPHVSAFGQERMRVSDLKMQYGVQYTDTGETSWRKNRRDAYWWADTLSRPSKTAGTIRPTKVVVRYVTDWVDDPEPIPPAKKQRNGAA